MAPCTTTSQKFSPPVNMDLSDKNLHSRTCCLFSKRFTKFMTKMEAVKLLPPDISKAFDKVPHSELPCKAANIGVRGNILEVLFDYLTNRGKLLEWKVTARR